MEAMRRFEVAWVRRRGVGRALPRAYLQADLDVVNPAGQNSGEKLLAEAEVIKVRAGIYTNSTASSLISNSNQINIVQSLSIHRFQNLCLPKEVQSRFLAQEAPTFGIFSTFLLKNVERYVHRTLVRQSATPLNLPKKRCQSDAFRIPRCSCISWQYSLSL